MKNSRILLLAFTLAVTGALAEAPAHEAKAPPSAADAKKAPAKKKTEPAKKAVPAKKPVTADPNVRIYKAGDPSIPKILGKDGKPIPTNPDAYDVSSATKK